MPHDSKGSRLKKGDSVTLQAKIVSLSESEQACNAVFKLEGQADYLPEVSCNSKLCTKVGESETEEAAQRGFNTIHTDKER